MERRFFQFHLYCFSEECHLGLTIRIANYQYLLILYYIPNYKSMKELRIRITLDIICFVNPSYMIPFDLSSAILGRITFLQNGFSGLLEK